MSYDPYYLRQRDGYGQPGPGYAVSGHSVVAAYNDPSTVPERRHGNEPLWRPEQHGYSGYRASGGYDSAHSGRASYGGGTNTSYTGAYGGWQAQGPQIFFDARAHFFLVKKAHFFFVKKKTLKCILHYNG